MAQNKLTIIYGGCGNCLSDATTLGDSINYKIMLNHYRLYSEYTINDSIDFFDYVVYIQNPSVEFDLAKVKEGRKHIILGDVLGTNSYRVTNNYKTKLRYERATIQKEFKNMNDGKQYRKTVCYVIVDSIKNRIKKWTLTDNRKKILGYECKQAFLIKDDMIIKDVWYTTELNCNFSNNGDLDLGLDGVILEEYLPRIKSFTTAIDIEKNARPIIYPKYKKRDLLDRKQFDKIREY